MVKRFTFIVTDPVAFKVGDRTKLNGQPGTWQIVRAWINRNGAPEYEAEKISLNRHELRKRLKESRR